MECNSIFSKEFGLIFSTKLYDLALYVMARIDDIKYNILYSDYVINLLFCLKILSLRIFIVD